MLFSLIYLFLGTICVVIGAWAMNEHTTLNITNKWYWVIMMGYVLGEAFINAGIHTFLKLFS